MGIDVRRGAMGGPASMTYAQRAAHRLLHQERLELDKLTLTTAHIYLPITDYSYAGTIIPPIFQTS